MFPGNDPQVIFYMAIKNQSSGYKERKALVQSIVKNVSKYLEIYDESKINTVQLEEIKVDSYTNKNVNDVKTTLNNYGINVVVVGTGEKVVDQYPTKGSKINKIDKVILITNGDLLMPNLTGFSMKDIEVLSKLLNLKVETKGNGYVTAQSIPPGTKIERGYNLVLEFTTYVPPAPEPVVENPNPPPE